MLVKDVGTRGRLEGCEIAENACGVWARDGGDPYPFGCTIRDHAAGTGVGTGVGVYVSACARGNVAIGAGNVFARNGGGDVVRL